MRFVQCDRCSEAFSIETPAKPEIHRYTIGWYDPATDRSSRDSEKDLCSPCLKAVLAVMDEKIPMQVRFESSPKKRKQR